MIEAVKLSRTYLLGETKVHALNNVNLKIKKGEFISIIGPSGSGKSTLLYLLGGVEEPSRGKVFVNGQDLTSLDEKQLCDFRRKTVGFIFQDFNLIPTLDCIENVIVPVIPYAKNLSETKKRAKELLKTVGLERRFSHKPSELSGGERQRVAIARALINNPEIVLADEPTGELDSKTGISVIKLMRELNEKNSTTFLIVTHDHNITHFTNRVITLRDGKIMSDKKNHAKNVFNQA